jgi:hypothetical protein
MPCTAGRPAEESGLIIVSPGAIGTQQLPCWKRYLAALHHAQAAARQKPLPNSEGLACKPPPGTMAYHRICRPDAGSSRRTVQIGQSTPSHWLPFIRLAGRRALPRRPSPDRVTAMAMNSMRLGGQ